jgi:hypothetical protein
MARNNSSVQWYGSPETALLTDTTILPTKEKQYKIRGAVKKSSEFFHIHVSGAS